jgi:hypothetical protein
VYRAGHCARKRRWGRFPIWPIRRFEFVEADCQSDYQSAAGYQPVVMSLRLTNGDENPA